MPQLYLSEARVIRSALALMKEGVSPQGVVSYLSAMTNSRQAVSA